MSDVYLDFDISQKIADDMRPKASMVVRKTAQNIKRQMLTDMSGIKSGEYYWSSKTGKLHQASAPGEAPARDTGNLANSIQVDKINDLTAAVDVHAEYGEILEYGSVHMAPRPFVEPAVELWRPEFEQELIWLIK